VIMSGEPAEGNADPSLASGCTVSLARPESGWQDDVVALAAELELQAEPDPQIPGAETRTWAKPMSQRLTSAYQHATQTASVSLSRPVVISTQ
jgi:hypothetical protein